MEYRSNIVCPKCGRKPQILGPRNLWFICECGNYFTPFKRR